MPTQTMQVDIVSVERSLFSGSATMLFAMGVMGELGIAPNHTQLLTILKPGEVRVITEQGAEDIFYISGGILEVQPYVVSILADSALRAADIDEAAVQDARMRAQKALSEAKSSFEYSAAAADLAKTAAQLQAVQSLMKTRDRIS